jgi:hypothetical protein
VDDGVRPCLSARRCRYLRRSRARAGQASEDAETDRRAICRSGRQACMMAPRHTVCLTGALDRPDDCRARHGPCERRRPRSLNGQRRARGFRGVFLDASRSRHEVFRPRTYRTARPVRLDIVVAPAFDPRLSSPLTTFEPCLCMWMDISFSRSGAGRDRFSRAGQWGGAHCLSPLSIHHPLCHRRRSKGILVL